MRFSLRFLSALLLTAPLFAALPARAQGPVITVSGVAEEAGKHSISFFALRADPSAAAQEFLSVLRNDLLISGYFRPTDQEQAAVLLSGSIRGGDFGISAQISASWLANTRTRAWTQTAQPTTIRDAAHALADTLVREITGQEPMASSKILFVGRRGTSSEIYACDADGARLRQLTSDRKLCLSPNWVPGKNAFTYTSWLSGVPAAYMVNLENNRRSLLSSKPGMNQGTVVSPHGNRAAIILSYAGSVDLYLIDAGNGRVLERLTRTKKHNEASPSWSPDGRSLVYVTDVGGVPRCHLLDLASGAPPKRLVYAYDIRENIAPEWGKNGKITFCGRSGGRYRIYVTDPASDPRVTIPTLVSPNDGCDYEDPSWAPDGRHIVCTRTSGFRRTLVVLDTLGDPPRSLFSSAGEWYLPSWSHNEVALPR